MRNNPVSGAVYFFRGMRLIFAPGIRAYVVVPLVVSVLVFSALIYFGTGGFRQLLDWLLPDWLDWLAIVLLPLFVITALVIVFFVTSSDSGSLVIDTITAGGKVDAPVAQRIFWCTFEGLVAIALLLGGGLGSLQAAAIATGFPFAIVLVGMVYCTFVGLRAERST